MMRCWLKGFANAVALGFASNAEPWTGRKLNLHNLTEEVQVNVEENYGICAQMLSRSDDGKEEKRRKGKVVGAFSGVTWLGSCRPFGKHLKNGSNAS